MTMDTGPGVRSRRMAVAFWILLTAGAAVGQRADLAVGSATAVPGSADLLLPVSLVTSGAEVTDLQFDVTFDVARVRLIGAQSGPVAIQVGKSAFLNLTGEGRARVQITGLNDRRLGQGVVALLRFGVRSGADAGLAPVGLDSVLAVAGNGAVVPSTAVAGNVEVVSAMARLSVGAAAVPAGATSFLLPVLLDAAGLPASDVQFDLGYDSTAMVVDSVFAGRTLTRSGKDVSWWRSGPGALRVMAAGLNSATMATGTVAMVRFHVRPDAASATYVVGLANPVLVNPGGESLPVDATAGRVAIDGQLTSDLSLSLPAQTSANGRFELPVDLTGSGPSLADIQFELTYPDSGLQLVGVLPGEAAQMAGRTVSMAPLAPGRALVLVQGLDVAVLPAGELVRVVMLTSGYGGSAPRQVRIGAVVAADPDGREVPVTSGAGWVTVSGTPSRPIARLRLGQSQLSITDTAAFRDQGVRSLAVRVMLEGADAAATDLQFDVHHAGTIAIDGIVPSAALVDSGKSVSLRQTNDFTDRVVLTGMNDRGLPAGELFTLLLTVFPSALGESVELSPVALVLSDRAGESLPIEGVSGVLMVDRLPQLTPIGPQVARAGVPLVLHLSGSDVDGDSLAFRVADNPTGSTLLGSVFTWTPTGGQAGRAYPVVFTVVDGRGGAVSETVTITVDQAIYQHAYDLPGGWSMVSLPFQVPNSNLAGLFPTAVSPMFRFNAAYAGATSFAPGVGYWVKLPGATQVTISGPAHADSELVAALPARWSMIGPGAVPLDVAALKAAYPALVSVFGWQGRYRSVTTLQPGQAYWANLAWPAVLDLSGRVAPVPAARLVADAVDDPASVVCLWAEGPEGRQAVALGAAGSQTVALPPPPPAECFDVRVEVGHGVGAWQVPAEPGLYPLHLQGPVQRLRWEDVPDQGWQLEIDGQVMPLTGSGQVQVTSLTQARVGRVAVAPVAAALYPCWPNPFNPSTSIRYDLGQPGPVRLRVFASSGQLVRELVAQVQPAGTHEVTWDGRDAQGSAVGNGVFLCQLEAGGRRAVTRMVLMK